MPSPPKALLLLLLATLTSPAHSSEAGDAWCPAGRKDNHCVIPAELREQVRVAAHYGRLMRNHDQAAWKATDVLRESGAFAEIGDQARGWLTRERGDTIQVRYFGEIDFDTVAIAQADFASATGRVTGARRIDPVAPPGADERAMLRARDRAVALDALRCSRNVNTIVLPDEHEGRKALRVYVMSAWSGGPMVFGGHHRVIVAEGDGSVLDATAHTRSCVLLEADASQGQPALAFVTHLQSETPNEFHVFLSLQHATSVAVGTVSNGLIWQVDGTEIRLLGRASPKAADEGEAK